MRRSHRSQLRLERRRRFLLRSVRRCHRAGQAYVGLEVGRDVRLVSIEALVLALSAVPHIGILDGYAAVLGDAASQTHAAIGNLQVLLAHLRERLDVRLERLLYRQLFLVQPVIESGQLSGELLDRLVLLLGVVPVDIEPGLDARRQEQRDPRFPADLLAARTGKLGGSSDDLTTAWPSRLNVSSTRPA